MRATFDVRGPRTAWRTATPVKIARIAMLVVVCVAAAAWHPARADEGAAAGGVYVTTLPTAADVWLDGTYVGRTPVLVDGLPVGRHALTISKTGWTVRELQVDVDPATIAMSSTRLDAGPRAIDGPHGRILVRNLPTGATLALDGKALASPVGRAFEVSAGTHRMTMQTAHGKATRTIAVLPDTATAVVVEEPRPAGARSAVIAPAEDYLPTDDFSLAGKKIVMRYGGHTVVARLGDASVRFDGVSVDYDGASELIGGRLYVPLALLEKLTEDSSK